MQETGHELAMADCADPLDFVGRVSVGVTPDWYWIGCRPANSPEIQCLSDAGAR